MGILLTTKKNPVNLGIYFSHGYRIVGNHLIKNNNNGSKSIILMYRRNLLKEQ
jgi:hypothetical protein